MDKETASIRRRLVEQWDEVKLTLEQMNSSAKVLPSDGWTIFQPQTIEAANSVGFEVTPVVFNLPERADHVSTNLYVVVQGQLSFRRELDANGALVTESFGTRAAYFRHKADKAAHVFGVHHDFALSELGHPVFHSQMRQYCDLWTHVKDRYQITEEPENLVKGILKNVRLPGAQMDFFSLCVQMCADHLLFKDSGKEERAAFNKLLQKSSFLKGAGFQVDRLMSDAARSCYRSQHWYPSLA